MAVRVDAGQRQQVPGQCPLSGLEKTLPHVTESPRRWCVQQWEQVVLLKGEQWGFSAEAEPSSCALKLPEHVRWRTLKSPCFTQLGFVQKQSSLVIKTRTECAIVNSGILTTSTSPQPEKLVAFLAF